MEDLKYWFVEHPTSTNIIKYLAWILLVFFLINWVRKLLKRNLPDEGSIKYKTQKGIEVIGYIFVILITITYFTGSIKDFGLAIGLLTAGITITLQELILSIAGSFYIFFVKVYKPGDRIEINGIKGDVIDIDSVYTTMMEIGEWVSSDNYSGRIVKLSNAFVFKGPVYNYSNDFPFVWDEFNLPIRYGSDTELAKSIIIEVAQEILSEYVKDSISKWQAVVNKYYIEDAQVDPTLAITLTDNWVQFNLRYIVDYKKRRHTKNLLHQEIGKRIEATNGEVKLASATFEIVSIPTLKIDEKTTNNKT
ncbi:MAG: mechanosensitive ion channel family protein [Flavobacteriales bacterium]|nr:mechanosensitive ion channel family protein [Flavobacteriales bacterium]MCW8913588.1 mechanosensitive ion channel family protein [Flavobacteriales bacterium]MCW8938657.1 mechanosensitive ion channel family protein [Flavobacteriales bacterium]MCW8940198.1 mechanosensitive ion channel family protein [Flavobacteriales bacterium]MCW8967856.1 mechanosensitive ion channel family protein [Flavobacteriales bacterium]